MESEESHGLSVLTYILGGPLLKSINTLAIARIPRINRRLGEIRRHTLRNTLLIHSGSDIRPLHGGDRTLAKTLDLMILRVLLSLQLGGRRAPGLPVVLLPVAGLLDGLRGGSHAATCAGGGRGQEGIGGDAFLGILGGGLRNGGGHGHIGGAGGLRGLGDDVGEAGLGGRDGDGVEALFLGEALRVGDGGGFAGHQCVDGFLVVLVDLQGG